MTFDATQDLLVEDSGNVLTVTFNRPNKLNAITAAMRERLEEAVHMFGESAALRVLVFRARGRYFSAGMDITGMGDMPTTGVELRYEYRRLHKIFDELEQIEKPVVLAAHAPCFGGALEMALSCDFRLAAESAIFALPEIEIGVIPGSGGVSRLSQLVGSGWARWLVMADKRVDAYRAREMGLVQDVYPDAEFDMRVDEFVQGLLALPHEVMGMAKFAIDMSVASDRGAARSVERVANSLLIHGSEHKNAIEIFRRGRSKIAAPD